MKKCWTAVFIILFSWGKLDVFMPGSDLKAVYLYDVLDSQSKLGGETDLARYDKKFFVTFGATTAFEDGGKTEDEAVFFGVDYDTGIELMTDRLRIGAYAGKNILDSNYIAGLKSSFRFYKIGE